MTSNIFTNRFNELRTSKVASDLHFDISSYEKAAQSILIRPTTPSWEDLEKQLSEVVNLNGFIQSRLKELYDKGYGAELVTCIDIAKNTARKSVYNLFATMTSKKAGNWETKTLPMVKTVWSVRNNTLKVLEQLGLPVGSTKAILKLCWKLRGRVNQLLHLATTGDNIKNKQALFFWLTKNSTLVKT